MRQLIIGVPSFSASGGQHLQTCVPAWPHGRHHGGAGVHSVWPRGDCESRWIVHRLGPQQVTAVVVVRFFYGHAQFCLGSFQRSCILCHRRLEYVRTVVAGRRPICLVCVSDTLGDIATVEADAGES